ncbi:MAG: serine/threonine-protein kinase [Thermoanaerobaculia bacterium]|jgi:Tol biopolymer transport system component|nr:serine/threonine-protein kinase [Thermoanaerobaculia bacterium]
MIGTRLGPYEILAKLGEGGMGEVFRARDTKLDREVAVKVLPPHLAADADALARFEREAKAVAALSHPNILAIFDFGRDGAIAFAAMELLEGETLRERLVAGALPARKALEIASQVATGLAAAHARGIVHRDLKPDNLFLTRDGQVKILDFGLARQSEPHGSKSQLLAAPTMAAAAPGTEPGAVLGTVGYMSPEQVRGETADARSDLFALGVVLYEMLIGRRAFAHGSAVETMSAILREEPPEIETVGERFSPALARLLQHCLEKRPDERFQSARDLAFDLKSLASGGSSTRAGGGAALVSAQSDRSARRRLLLAAGLVLAGALAGWLAAGLSRKPEASSTPVLRPTFRQLTKLPGGEGNPSIAPDGESFVFVKRDGGDADLFLQRIDGTKPIPLTTDCAQDDVDPAFSPDGRSIAYRSDCGGGGIFVMGATGEASRRVTELGYAPAWSPDAAELAVVTERTGAPTSRNSVSELWVVKVETGARRRVSELDAMAPTWSPDGRRIAFWGLRDETFQRDLWSVAADGSPGAKESALSLVDDPAIDWAPVYSHDGRWLYFASTRGGTFNLWRLALESATGKPQGAPEPVTAPSSWAGPFDLSADGRRIVFVDRNAQTEIVRAAVDPARLALASAPAPVFSGSFEIREQQLSFDGASVVFTNEDMPQHLHLVHSDGSGYRQLTTGVDRNRQGAWSPDGQWIAFQTNRGASSLAVIHPDGGGWQAIGVGRGFTNPRWSPDGKRLLSYNTSEGGSILDLATGFATPAKQDLPPIAPGVLFWPIAWSPDGSLVAGSAVRAGQIGEIHIWSTADRAYREMPWRRGEQIDYSVVFIDRDRLVFGSGTGLSVGDLRGGELEPLYTPPPGHLIVNLSGSSDGRSLTWIDRADESDIWLMTLDEKTEL